MDIYEQLIGSLIPDPEACRKKAEELKATYPKDSPERLAERAVSQAKTLLAAAGAGSGVVGNPLAAAPLALAEAGIVLRTEAKLAGVVAALLEPSVLQDSEAFTADVMAIVFPGAAAQAVRGLVVQAGQATTKTLIRKYISKDVLKAVVKFAAKYLGIKVTQRAIITKTVPLVGAGIGAAWNWIEVKIVGKRAIQYYRNEPIETPEPDEPGEMRASA